MSQDNISSSNTGKAQIAETMYTQLFDQALEYLPFTTHEFKLIDLAYNDDDDGAEAAENQQFVALSNGVTTDARHAKGQIPLQKRKNNKFPSGEDNTASAAAIKKKIVSGGFLGKDLIIKKKLVRSNQQTEAEQALSQIYHSQQDKARGDGASCDNRLTSSDQKDPQNKSSTNLRTLSKKQRSISQQPLKPLPPKKLHPNTVQQYIQNYQVTYQSFYGNTNRSLNADKCRILQTQPESANRANTVQEGPGAETDKSQLILNNNSITRLRTLDNQAESIELINESLIEISKQVITPPQQNKKINYWEEMPNPYADKWTKKVLKEHFHVLLKQKKLQNCDKKKGWIIRKVRQNKDQAKSIIEPECQMDTPFSIPAILPDLLFAQQSARFNIPFHEIQLDLLLNSLYERPVTDIRQENMSQPPKTAPSHPNQIKNREQALPDVGTDNGLDGDELQNTRNLFRKRSLDLEAQAFSPMQAQRPVIYKAKSNIANSFFLLIYSTNFYGHLEKIIYLNRLVMA